MAAAAKRKRGVPVQVYFSTRERADLARTAKRRGRTLSDQVRDWVRRAAAAERGRQPKPVYADPRQIDLVS